MITEKFTGREIVKIAAGSAHDQHPTALCEVRHGARLLQQRSIDAGGYP
jgi:hypothetical protein